MSRSIIGRIIFCVAAMLSTAALAADSAYPSQPIHIVVPYAAGSTGDMVVRLIAPRMEQALKGKIIIENRPGAGGNIGTNFVANAAPDGHTLLMAAVSNYAINQFVYRSLIDRPIKPLAPVSKVIETPYVMYASGAVQVKDVQAFIALARERPGTFFYASSGVGTAPHLAGLLFARLAGVQLEHVPYKGNAESVRALLANEVQVYFASVSAGLEQVAGGIKGIHVLTTAWPSRLPGYPDAPSAAESGVPGLSINWWGLGAPSGTPLAVREKLAAAVAQALDDPQVRAQFESWESPRRPTRRRRSRPTSSRIPAVGANSSSLRVSSRSRRSMNFKGAGCGNMSIGILTRPSSIASTTPRLMWAKPGRTSTTTTPEARRPGPACCSRRISLMAARKARRWTSSFSPGLAARPSMSFPWRGYRSQDKYNFSFVAGPLVERARSLSSRTTACVPP